MTGEPQDIQPEKDQTAGTPDASTTRLYASADLSTNPVARPEVTSNPTMDALEFKAPDFRAPTDVAAAPLVPPEKTQEATDVANLFSAISKGDKAQIIALQSKLLGSNNLYEGSYMGQNFRLSREKYNEKTHKTYSEAQYLYVGKNLVTRSNIGRDETKHDVQTSGHIVSVALNQYAPGSDTSVAAGNVTDGKFRNAHDQRDEKGKFVQTILPTGQDVVKQLVAKAQTANGADVRLGKGTNAFEAKVNLTGDGTVSSVVGKTPLEPAKPVTEVKPEVTQPQPQPGQIETFLRENKDNKARELVGAISTGDPSLQAQAIKQLVSGGVRTLNFTRPGAGERPQELSFVPNQNGSITVKLDGQTLGRVAQDGRMQTASLSQNLKNLGLESNGTINVGVRGKDQKFELGKSPVVASPEVLTRPDGTQRIESPAIQSQKLQEIAAKLNAQGYAQTNLAPRPGDVLASVRPNGETALATVKGIDGEGNLLVEDNGSKQTLKASDWSNTVNPERRNLTAIMRKVTPARSELPPVETPTRTTEAPVLTGALLAQQANNVKDADQLKALDRLVSPYGVKLTAPEGSRQLANQLIESYRFAPVANDQPIRPGDIHILAPKGSATVENTLAWDNKGSPGMVLAITNDKGEMVRLSDGQKVDESQFVRFTQRAGIKPEIAPPLEAAVVHGRLFPAGTDQRQSAADPIAMTDFENRLKSSTDKFAPQGQIQFNDIQSRLQSMDVGTTMILNSANPNEKLIAVVGEAPAAPGSTQRTKVLFTTDGSGQWKRVDDLSRIPNRTTAEVYKPNQKVEIQATTEANPEFEHMLGEVTKQAFNISSLVGDPRAKERFYGAIKSGALPIDALKRYLSESGDPQTSYMTRLQITDQKRNLVGSAGIGVELKSENGNATITDVFANAPSTRAIRLDTNQSISLKAGDIITSVNNKPVTGKSLDDVSAAIRGQADTNVEMEIKRPKDGSPGQFETFKVQLTRKPVSSVQASIDETGIVHIRMNRGFTINSGEDFRREVERIKQENGDKVKGYVLDLRRNHGGVLDSSLQILAALAPNPDSVLLNVRERNPSGSPPYRNFEYRNSPTGIVKIESGQTTPVSSSPPFQGLKKGLIDKPISVLVDGHSASSSEVIASAMQDWGYPVYGSKTYGKGTVQIMPIEGDKGARVTIAQYLSPVSHTWVGNAADIKRGIVPDFKIPANSDQFDIGSAQDNQIIEARRLLLQSLMVR